LGILHRVKPAQIASRGPGLSPQCLPAISGKRVPTRVPSMKKTL
jgi:hypothetical protein